MPLNILYSPKIITTYSHTLKFYNFDPNIHNHSEPWKQSLVLFQLESIVAVWLTCLPKLAALKKQKLFINQMEIDPNIVECKTLLAARKSRKSYGGLS